MKQDKEFNVIKISDKLFLIRQKVTEIKKEVVKNLPVDHIIWIDCSLSMSGELTQIARHLKNKLPLLVKDEDTVTIGWFSSKEQFGILQEQVKVNNLQDLNNLNNAIDRFLKPVHLTGFEDPLSSTLKIINNIKELRNKSLSPNSAISFFFLTDGYDNQSNKEKILDLCKDIKNVVQSSVIVEYGYYCDRGFLTKMAENIGGSLVFSENFINYEPVMELSLSKKITGTKKIEILLDNKPCFGFGYILDSDNNIITLAEEINSSLNSFFSIPEQFEYVYYFSNTDRINGISKPEFNENIKDTYNASLLYSVDCSFFKVIYAAIFLLSQRMLTNELYNMLSGLGDVELIQKFTNSFGKQDISEFEVLVIKIVRGEGIAFNDGYKLNLMPDNNKFCILDLFELLMLNPNNKWYPNNEKFQYRRTSVKRIQADSILTDEEQLKLNNLVEEMKNIKDIDKLKDLSDKITALTNKDKLTFKVNDTSAGYPINQLVWNKKRPNLSVQVCFNGTIKLPKNNYNLPEFFPTFKFRNFTIIKDGLINVRYLPVSIDALTYKKLTEEDVICNSYETKDLTGYFPDNIYYLDLSKLPVINRSMVNDIYAEKTFTNAYEQLKLQAANKIYKEYEENSTSNNISNFIFTYGLEATEYLEGLGIDEKSGYSPKTLPSKNGETYEALEMQIHIKGASSLPSLTKLSEKMEKGSKLNIADKLMIESLNEIEKFKENVKTSSNKDSLFSDYIRNTKNKINQDLAKISIELAKVKFVLVLGNVWFKEFNSRDENSMTLNFNDEEVNFTAEVKKVAVEI